jgi:5'-deoxynucleotidase YfbR-like HD superfamily hydrolase
MDNIRKSLALREGGYTQRMHTVPVLGDTSVARHSWNMASLLWVLHPNPSQDLVWSVLFHDVPERWVGDTPSPAKYSINPALGKELKEAELKVEAALGLEFGLNEEERRWLKALDILEFVMYCDDQSALGNQNVKTGRANAMRTLDKPWVPEEVQLFLLNYKWQRTNDIVPGEVMTGLDIDEVTDA